MKQLSTEQILALPPVINLSTLGQALGLSEPVIREQHRTGELARLGIRVLKLGAQYRVVTADLLQVMGMTGGTDRDIQAWERARREEAS
ncbi:MAG: hypothetical protein M0030_22805 [Actinomycetota bacterium]|nr:hypothetical protein [Actinomycetota bacterium]